MKRSFLIVLFLIVLLISACSPVTPAVQETEVAPQPTVAEGFHPLTTRTGNKDIDPVLDVVASGDIQGLRSLIQFTNTKCTRREGLGGPPKCREREAEGTPVEVLPSFGPEGSFIHKDEIENWTGVGASGLYAVYEVSSNAYSDKDYPAGKYAAIFLTEENEFAMSLQVTNGRIVRVDYHLDISPEALNAVLERDAAHLILAPLN